MLLDKYTTVQSNHIALLASELAKQDMPVVDQFEPIADFEELFTFAESNPTPIEYAEQNPAWCLESVAARVIEAIGIAAHETLDKTEWEPLAKILLEHIEYLYTYSDAPTARERLAAGSALVVASCVCEVLPQAELWRLAGFGRISVNLNEVSPKSSHTHIIQPIDAAFQFANTRNLSILDTAVQSYNLVLNRKLIQQNSVKFPLSDNMFFDYLNLEYSGLDNVKSAYLQGDLTVAKSEYTKFRIDLLESFELNSHIEETDTFSTAKTYLECQLKLSIYPTPAIYGTTEIGMAALIFPEFRFSEQLLRLACRRYEWIIKTFFYPDGFHKDLLLSSQAEAMRNFSKFLNIHEKMQQKDYSECVEKLKTLLEEQTHACTNIRQPDLSFPPFVTGSVRDRTDCIEKCNTICPVPLKDNAPKISSQALPYSGYYIIRNSDESDAQYLCFDSGPLGKQCYEDKLSFVLYAHGRQLITHNLDNNDDDEPSKSSKSFNSILIDGEGQIRSQTSESEYIPDPDTRWITTTTFDFVEGWYKASDYHHKRTIFYVKNAEYYILHDTVLGEGEHALEQVFQLTTPHIMQNAGQIWTQDAGHSNIFIGAADAEDISIQLDGNTLTFSIQRELPTVLNVVLFPLKPDVEALPKVRSIAVSSDADVLSTGFTVESNGVTDTFLISDDGYTKMSITNSERKIVFEGEHLFLRGDKFVMINGRYLEVDKKVLIELDELCERYVNM